ncbi:hypothetical protein ML401_26865 [Bradyrhizobium sp. 62B]|jgi:choline dehydrogenase-like flavoprotein|uniref:hypothetical protein n=1 Tax=Bradyrhizobium TaxID=374 RepID=UPI002168EF31|nr:hypothetical protein [Bradyrhizobium centrosematis]MCS3762890.1 choline dehydrogenase-like flavoprotein [Bradyrhizobium centrosematis]MCS3775559.1 choline dehydrogenase-like flavoprotein [Bradyrhizobium centrosematis]WIW45050.1 hypothetical protein ML401_26865 [Bradyrhizobium sp. 62B]
MPAFSFEKISPPARRGAAAAAPQKPRSVINQMIDRIAERRAKRAVQDERAMRQNEKPAK